MKLSAEVKLGIFVVLVALAAAFLILTFGEIPIFKEPTKTYVAYFRDVGGLSKGAEVRVAGVRAGKVKEVVVENGRVKVVFEVKKDITLYKDAVAYIGTLGLMGDKYLGINPGSPESGELRSGEAVFGQEVALDTDRLIAELTETAQEFKMLARNLNLILEENRLILRETLINLNSLVANLNEITVQNKENINRTLENLRILTASLERLANNLNAMVSENRSNVKEISTDLAVILRELKRDLPVLVANLRELSSDLNSIVKANKTDINKTIVSVRETTENLAKASQKLDTILARLERGEGTLGKLIKDESLYVNLNRGVKTLGKAGEVVERTQLYVGMRGELYKGGDSKGILTVKLVPDEKKYYLLEVVGDSRGRVYREEFVGGGEVVKKEFKPELTLQYAHNFSVLGRLLTVRGGLKESTGGVGADYHIAPNKYVFADVWDFGRKDRPQDKNLKPNLQVGLHWHLGGNLYLRVGGDDLLNPKMRGAFGGVGLLFKDDDLKYILGGVGLPLR